MYYVLCRTCRTNTYYVTFCTSTSLLSGGTCVLDLISQNQMCSALSTWGRNDPRLRFWSSTLPSSTICSNSFLFLFHVESVDCLIPNFLHISIPFIDPTCFKICNFSFNVRSTCWCLGFGESIIKSNILLTCTELKLLLYRMCIVWSKEIIFIAEAIRKVMHLFSCSRCMRFARDRFELRIVASYYHIQMLLKQCQTCRTQKQ